MPSQTTAKRRGDGRIRPPGPDPKVTVVHRAQYLALLALAGLARIAPNRLAQWTGGALGSLFHAVDKPHRKVALLNMDRVFGDQVDETEKRRLTRACYRHFGRALVEALRMSRITQANFREWTAFENVEVFEDALAEGSGAILCTAHYGNWELMNLALGYLGVPMSVMARPMDNPLVHRFLERLRARSGNRVIYKHKSVRKLLATLRENRVVGIVNDQNVHDRNRLMVDFFGHGAATTPTPAALAYKTGAPIITGYAEPLGGGRYLLRYDPLIQADPAADKDAEILRVTQLLNRRLEAQLRRLPHCWLWVHKRFKMDKSGETDYYRQHRPV